MTMYRLNSVPANVGALPIIKGGSPNIWDEEWEVGDIAYASGANISGSSWIRSKNYIPVHSKTSYFMRCKVSNNCNLYFYDANKTYLGQNTGGLITAINNVAFNTPTNSYYMRFATQTSFEDNTFSINYPSNLTSYYPHNQPIVTFNTDLAEKLVSMLVEVKAVQSGSGTPSPSNPRTINGFSACDVTNAEKYIRVKDTNPQTYTQNGITIKTYSNGRIELSGTATANTTIYVSVDEFTIFTENSRTIKFNNNFTGTTTVSFIYNNTVIDGWGMNTINRQYTNFSALAGKTINQLAFTISSGDTITNGSLMIEFIVTDTATTYTINFGQTVYGATLDPLSGKLTITHQAYTYVGDISESWGKNGNYYYTPLNALYKTSFTVIADRYKGVSPRAYTDLQNFECALSPVLNHLNIRDDSGYATADDFRTWLSSNNLTVVYKYVTPIEIQLSSTEVQAIIGNNNIYADTGDTSLNYWVTINKYIGQ